MKKLEIIFGIIRLPLDMLAGVVGFIIAYNFRLTNFVSEYIGNVEAVSFYGNFDNFTLHYALPLVAYLVFLMALFGLYNLKTIDSFWSQVKRIMASLGFWLGSIISYFFIVRDFPFSRFVLLFSFISILFCIIFARTLVILVQRLCLKYGYGKRRVLLVADSKSNIQRIIKALNKDVRFEIVGYISPEKFKLKLKYLGTHLQLLNILNNYQVDDVFQVGNSTFQADVMQFCRFFHKEYHFIPEVLEVQRHNIILEEVSGLPIFRVNQTPLDGWGRVLKRMLDLIGSGLGLILLSPLLLLIALLIKLDSKGPIFFKYLEDGSVVKRIGYRGKPFYCYKFRTMTHNTHSMRYSELAENDLRKDSPLVKIKNDPRVTKLGILLRRLDLDELPQLWNVFKGEMSLVGPRPHLVEEVAKYNLHHRYVLTVKPGITGLAQVSGRSDLNFEEEVRLDSYYVENWGIWLDIKILLKTILVVIKGHGEFK
jgi:exopolysaccharide biosynthesis polyprenyl glycosylphosphotransferase